MAEAAAGDAAPAPEISFKVKTSGDSSHTMSMPETATVMELKRKLAGADLENVPVERQRLIYSGRVMKNDEALSTYKIKPGNTVHMVKSAASNPHPPATSSSGGTASSTTSQTPVQVPTNMAAGTANNPLAGLTGARYAGMAGLPSADMFGPDGGMVGSMMDEDQMANMLSNPMVAQQMNEMMNNDHFIDMIIQGNPMLRNNPNAREIVRSPMFRNMITNPDAMRSAMRLRRMMGGDGSSGASAFPAPGVTDTTPADPNATNQSQGQGQGPSPSPNQDPMASMSDLMAVLGGTPFGSFGAPPGNNASSSSTLNPAGTGNLNPFAAYLNQAAGNPASPINPTNPSSTATGTTGAAGSTDATTQPGDSNPSANQPSIPPNPLSNLFPQPGANTGGAAAANNPFGLPAMPPEAMQQLLQMMGGGTTGSAPAPPPDNRPPEERYAEQLRQLNDMGFYDFDRNVAALRRSGGSVQGAVEYLLSS